MLRVVQQFHLPGLNRLGEIGEEITGEVESAVRKDVDLYKRCVQVSVQSTVFPVADKKADK
jgi:hypothetical protein